MKLATLKDGSRDGQLVVVSRDLALAHYATGIATRLQQVLDDWNFVSPQLEDLSATLNGGKCRHAFAFDPRHCMAPLPRAYQWVSTRAPGVDAEPGLVQRCSDPLLGPCDDAPAVDPGMSLACSPALAVITGDVPKAAPPEQALDGVRLLVLVNDWSLNDGVEHETAPLHGSPGAAFAPVAVTPDELGAAWSGGQVKLPLQIRRNGRPTDPAVPDDGRAVTSFGALLSRLVRARRLSAGSLVGGGAGGARMAGPLSPGDSVRIELIGPDGLSVFGAIEQHVQDTLGAG